ncbi:M67 family metallopeptidase [Geobacter argillaceus]|uniref:Proteasome lid subunit RPN8/RPN11 n=1 Tax=Geobacter argillaceus TaxID=345631 RepID=A0A562VM99_9BACT|nr:M67 family metallopeptidase [Geobacter argillaceus]TWJ19093.1 proteasome lid subunit RPN8/RPN11 [Geobacter argillaceus]
MLKLPRAIYDALIGHAREGFPLEVCGILGGLDGEVSGHFPMTNIDASSEHFTLDPKEQFRVIKELRASKLEMVAVYHSHPASPARPSAEDIRLALTPDISHVIVSLAGPEPVLKSFRITDGVVEPEEISLI